MKKNKGRPLAKTDERTIKQNIEKNGFTNEDAKILEFFATRFSQEFEKKETTLEDFSKSIGIAKSTLSNYKNGERIPPINVLVKIAKELNCSTDYLLGLTNLKSTDRDLKIVHEVTGLSDKAIEYFIRRLHIYKRPPEEQELIDEDIRLDESDIPYDEVIRTLNFLLENETEKYSFFKYLYKFLWKSVEVKNYLETVIQNKGEDFLKKDFPKQQWKAFKKQAILEQNSTKVILDRKLFEMENDIKEKYDIKDIDVY